jgi:hypothetical protein
MVIFHHVIKTGGMAVIAVEEVRVTHPLARVEAIEDSRVPTSA